MGSFKEAILIADQGKEDFLQQERGAKGGGKRPPKHTTNGKVEHGHGSLKTPTPVDESGGSQHGHVHGEAGGQVGGAGVEITGAKYERHDKEQANPRVQGQADSPPHERLAEGADESQNTADKVELGDFVGVRKQPADIAHNGMEGDVKPVSDGIVGRVFPGLEAIAVAQIVCWFPVIEGLVTVLDGGEQSSNQVGSEEDVEGRNGLDRVGISNCSRDTDVNYTFQLPIKLKQT